MDTTLVTRMETGYACQDGVDHIVTYVSILSFFNLLHIFVKKCVMQVLQLISVVFTYLPKQIRHKIFVEETWNLHQQWVDDFTFQLT